MAVSLTVRDLRNASAPVEEPSLTFDQSKIVIGRGAHADVRIPVRTVSETHAALRIDAGEISITDDGSTNGTLVNGTTVVQGRRKVLRDGDRIGLPGFEIVVRVVFTAADPPERTGTVARGILEGALARAGDESTPPEIVLETGRRAGARWVVALGAKLVAGRGESCDIVLDDPDCSRQHVEFRRERDGVVVRDLGSKNGTLVGGRPVSERRLRDGDEITFGRSALRFVDPVEEMLRAFESGVDERSPVVSTSSSDARASASSRTGTTIPPTSGASASADASGAQRESAARGASSSSRPSRTPGAGTNAASSSSSSFAAPVAARPRRRETRAADWVVILLALVILGISAIALYYVIRGTPGR